MLEAGPPGEQLAQQLRVDAGRSFSQAAGISWPLSAAKLMHGLSMPRRRQFIVSPSAGSSASSFFRAKWARAAFSSASSRDAADLLRAAGDAGDQRSGLVAERRPSGTPRRSGRNGITRTVVPKNGSTPSRGSAASVMLSSRLWLIRFLAWIIRRPYSIASKLSSDWMK